MYEVIINKNEKMQVSIISKDFAEIKTFGGKNFEKDHGTTNLSYIGVCNLIDILEKVKKDMEENRTDFF